MASHHDYNKYNESFIRLWEGNLDDDEFLKIISCLKTDEDLCRYYLNFLSINVGLREFSNLEKDLHTMLTADDLPSSEDIFREAIKLDLENKKNLQKNEWDRKQQEIKQDADLKLKEFLLQYNQDDLNLNKQKRTLFQLDLSHVKFFVKALAACMIISVFVWKFVATGQAPVVAKITSRYQVQWNHSEMLGDGEALLQQKEYDLKSGVVDIEFYRGAKVTIKGPAKFNLESANGAYLRQGKLTANVPQKAIGFTIHTPSASYIDRGTSFTVEIHPSGASELQVYSGQVDILTSQKLFDSIFEGQARSVSSDGYSIDEIKYNETTSIATFPIESVSSDKSEASVNETSAKWNQSITNSVDQNEYENLIMGFQPVHYYRFDPKLDKPDEKYLTPESFKSISDDSMPIWTRTNRVLHFDQSMNSFLGLKGIQKEAMAQGSIIFRFKIDQLPNDDEIIEIMSTCSIVENQISISEFNYPHDVSGLETASEISIDSYGILELKFGRDAIKDSESDIGTLNSLDRIQTQQWYHVAFTYNRDKFLSLYINGSQHDIIMVTGPLHENPWLFAFLGVHFDTEKVSTDVTAFRGAFDDFAIFDYALSAKQIEQLYDSALMK